MPRQITGKFEKECDNIHIRDISVKNETQFWKRAISKHASGLERKINSIEDLSNVPTSVIVDIINSKQTEYDARENEIRWNKKVAPKEDIIADEQKSLKEDKLMFASSEIGTILTRKAGQGHACSGHSAYRQSYPNTSMDDILDVLESNSRDLGENLFTKEKFRNQNQQTIDNIVYLVENWYKEVEKNINHLKLSDAFVYLTNPDGITPLNNFSFNDGFKTNILEWQRGLYFTSLMDNFPIIRTKGFEKYNYQMGGGESHLVDMKKLKRNGIGLEDLARTNYGDIFGFMNHITAEKRIDVLTKMGVFLDKQFDWENFDPSKTSWDEIKKDPSIVDITKNKDLLGQYMREVKGRGVGDDIAIYLSSFLPDTFRNRYYVETPFDKASRLLGGLFGDQEDTTEKDSSHYFPGGQDEFTGKYFNALFRNACKSKKFRDAFNISERKDGQYNLVDEDTVVDFTIASANTKYQSVHCSQRRFYKVPDGYQETCAIKEYVKHMYKTASRDSEIPVDNTMTELFEFNPELISENAKYTFKQIRLKKIREIFDKRYDLIKDSNKREERIYNFFSNKY